MRYRAAQSWSELMLEAHPQHQLAINSGFPDGRVGGTAQSVSGSAGVNRPPPTTADSAMLTAPEQINCNTSPRPRCVCRVAESRDRGARKGGRGRNDLETRYSGRQMERSTLSAGVQGGYDPLSGGGWAVHLGNLSLAFAWLRLPNRRSPPDHSPKIERWP